jgi:ribosomal protein S18 acetylase RimI-like enzyme
MSELIMPFTFKLISLTAGHNLTEHDIQGIIAVQKSHIIKAGQTAPNNGFLATCFTQIELKELYDSGATLITAEQDQKIAGFTMITGPSVFTEQLDSGAFSSQLSVELDYQYLYQVAVLPQFKRMGLGHQLINEAKKFGTDGLIADILIEPLNNQASIDLFLKAGFQSRGILSLPSYRDFGALKSEVFTWSRKSSEN